VAVAVFMKHSYSRLVVAVFVKHGYSRLVILRAHKGLLLQSE